jgi:hypothetical protein
MLKMRFVVAATAVLTAGILIVQVAAAAEKAATSASASNARWDDEGPGPSGRLGELALMQGDGAGPPGPPPDEGDEPPPLPRRAGRDQPQRPEPPGPPPRGFRDDRKGPPHHEFDGRMPPDRMGEGRGFGGEMGRRDGMGGPGMNPNCPLGPGGDMGPGMMMRNDTEMRKLFEKDMKLDRGTREAAARYQGATTEERDKIKQDVEKMVNEQFNVRQERRKLEVKRLTEQLQRVSQAVDRREKARKEIVEKRVSELLGVEKELDF